MRICIISAMEKEYRMLSGLSSIAGHEIIPAVSGIGKVNAALGAAELIAKYAPDCIINTGVAGGLGANVHMGDAVVGVQCAYHDVWCGEGNEPGQVQGLPARFDADPDLLGVARSLDPRRTVHYGLICTGDRFIEKREEDMEILRVFPDALACDMESAAFAQVCCLKGVPFMSLRIVSDCVADGGHELSYNDFWANVSEVSFGLVKELIEKIPHRQ